MSQDVRERYRDLLDAVDEMRPGFWTEMADELRDMFVRHITTCGSGVREFPLQREARVQVVVATRDARVSSLVKKSPGLGFEL